MPKVSVVITAYNEERYIQEAVESVLDQTYKDFELIVVDDGSEDGTAGILERFRDPRLHLVHQENAGFAAAANTGIELAQGRYVARLDADDCCLPQRLEKQTAYLDTYSDVGVVGSFATVVNTRTGKRHLSVRPVTDFEIRNSVLRVNPIINSTALIRREVIEKIGLYDTELAFGEDYDYWIRAMQYFKIFNIAEALVIRREHPNSATCGLGLAEHIGVGLGLRIKAIRLLGIPSFRWMQLCIPIVGIILFRLGFNKEKGYRMMYEVS